MPLTHVKDHAEIDSRGGSSSKHTCGRYSAAASGGGARRPKLHPNAGYGVACGACTSRLTVPAWYHTVERFREKGEGEGGAGKGGGGVRMIS